MFHISQILSAGAIINIIVRHTAHKHTNGELHHLVFKSLKSCLCVK